ncbi:MAG: Helix-turn-helix domain [Symbiobacteriaceae bacterium]|jgi:DNA-binding transcriptional ArsR family regulator|nr:Helix-turn-helix domain [Symbiobacteriaceae bacterium]
MDLEARMQRLEAAVEEIRTRLQDLTATPGATPGSRPPAPRTPGERAPDALMRSIAEGIREASRDESGTEQSMILQAVVDRPRSTYISMATMEELRTNVDAAAIAQLASVLSSESRLKILQALAAGERSAAEVGAAAGLEGGPLYHHLSELQEGGFLVQPSRGRYAMTRRGRDLYYQMALLVRTPYDQQPHELGSTPPGAP